MQKKYKLALLVTAAILLGAWQGRPNHNRPKSASIEPNGSSLIPIMYKAVDGIHHSNVLSNLDGSNYSHIGVISTLRGPISLVTSEFATAPSSSSTEKLHVASSASAAFDDVSVFKYLYVMSETGQSLSDGTLKIMVW
jgi:hypothetical protein